MTGSWCWTAGRPATSGSTRPWPAWPGRRRRPFRPKAWVGHPPSGICDAYLARLAAAGAVREERGKLLGFIPASRWRIADPARAADARARLDAIVHAPGQVGIAEAAYAGLASASGLGPVLYPGRPAGRCAAASSRSPRGN